MTDFGYFLSSEELSPQELVRYGRAGGDGRTPAGVRICWAVACGPDATRAAEMVAKYVEVGFDEVYISQMGPDQGGGIAFLREEVLPLLT
ncbi:MAG: hypothetical protein QOG99_3227 [Frankiales bacterium]|jgi:hypothetical protein|nr:hypothetical protein [Frankiales bacterium]